MKFKFELKQGSKKFDGRYKSVREDPTQNKLILYNDANNKTQTILHELLHAACHAMMREPLHQRLAHKINDDKIINRLSELLSENIEINDRQVEK
jgi:hypothetical protein